MVGQNWDWRLPSSTDGAGKPGWSAFSLLDWSDVYWSLLLDSTATADDYAGSTSTTGTVAIGGSTPGNIEVVGDTDWFRITLTAGHTYRFNLQAHDSGQGSLPDPFLRLRDSAGNSITFDDDSGTGLDSQITYAATTSGTYYLSAGSAITGSGIGTYLVSAADATDDYAGSTSTTGTVAIGGSTPGNIEVVGDTDWFRITLTAGHTYRFNLQAHDSGQGSLPDPFLRLRDSAGNSITFDDDSGTGLDSQITYAATTSGTYYLSAGSAITGSGTGTYLVSAADVTAPSGFHINLIADSTVASAPAGFTEAIRAAADLIEQALSDNITINIRYGWGSYNNSIDPGLAGSTGAYANAVAGNTFTYSTVRSWLVSDSMSGSDATAISSLPTSNSAFPNGNSSFFVTSSQEKALGHFTGDPDAVDGAVAFGTAVDSQFWIPVALHEITHSMGRVTLYYETAPVILDMYRYDAAGQFQWTEGLTGAAPSYFSIDGGQTDLADFGETSDYSDFLNTGVQGPNDSFNEFYHDGTLSFLTAVDITTMDVIGFDAAVPCFVRGTLVRAESGELPIEALGIGDRLLTAGGGSQPIRWIGRRVYDGRFIAGNRNVLPVRVKAGALAQGVPVRDLWLSPQHALYIDGLLIAAGHLVNGTTIVQADSVDTLEYFNIEFDDQQIIFADGAAAESYVDCDNRLMFANGAEYATLYPHDWRPTWHFCAPRPERSSPEIVAIRAALIKRATALGHSPTTDPDLHLVVDGTVLRPQSVAGQIYRFAVSAGVGSLWLGSRSTVPAETEAEAHDIRRLGVAVERIVIADGELTLNAAHGCVAFRDGFHADEPTHRWTNGRARLPDALLRPFAGGFTVEVHLTESGLFYLLPPRLDAFLAAA